MKLSCRKKGAGFRVSGVSWVGEIKYDWWIGGLETDCTCGGVDKCCVAICHYAIPWEREEEEGGERAREHYPHCKKLNCTGEVFTEIFRNTFLLFLGQTSPSWIPPYAWSLGRTLFCTVLRSSTHPTLWSSFGTQSLNPVPSPTLHL